LLSINAFAAKYAILPFADQTWCESFPTSAKTVSFHLVETDRKGFTKKTISMG